MKHSISLALFGLAVLVLIGGTAVRRYLALDVPSQVERGVVVVNQLPTETKVQDPDVADNTAEMTDSAQPVAYRLEVVAEDLFVPWSIVFPSTDRILFTERNGNLRVIENGQLRAPIHRFSEVSQSGEEGLMGMALHPEYQINKWVYAAYAYSTKEELSVRVVRFADKGSSIEELTTIIENLPAARYHAGTRLGFGPDGKLYITTGDATDKQIAQRMDSLGGKILRLNDDGTVPSDNPFPNSPIFTLGHRNAQGLDWHPVSGQLYENEHGPSGFDGPGGGDEVNFIEPGKNYGWPVVSHEKSQSGFEDPRLVFTPAIAPGSGSFYSGNVFPQLRNQYLIGMLKGEGILRVKFDELDPKKVIEYEKLPEIELGRIREVAESPDGLIYFSTSNQDGRGNALDGDDKIYRLVPR